MIKLRILGKGNKEREVLIDDETADVILKNIMLAYNINTEEALHDILKSSNPLFMKINGQMIYDTLRKHSIRVLGHDIRPHELRSLRAIELHRKGVDILDIKNYLGHSSVATTEVYLRREQEKSLDNIQRALEK